MSRGPRPPPPPPTSLLLPLRLPAPPLPPMPLLRSPLSSGRFLGCPTGEPRGPNPLNPLDFSSKYISLSPLATADSDDHGPHGLGSLLRPDDRLFSLLLLRRLRSSPPRPPLSARGPSGFSYNYMSGPENPRPPSPMSTYDPSDPSGRSLSAHPEWRAGATGFFGRPAGGDPACPLP